MWSDWLDLNWPSLVFTLDFLNVSWATKTHCDPITQTTCWGGLRHILAHIFLALMHPDTVSDRAVVSSETGTKSEKTRQLNNLETHDRHMFKWRCVLAIHLWSKCPRHILKPSVNSENASPLCLGCIHTHTWSCPLVSGSSQTNVNARCEQDLRASISSNHQTVLSIGVAHPVLQFIGT